MMASNQIGNNENPQQLNVASIQNGDKDDSQQVDEGMYPIKNGNNKSPPQLEVDVKKVVVVGEPRCGKTRFIRQYYDYHSTGNIYSHNGVRVYPCELEGVYQNKEAAVFEIPGDPEFVLEQRQPHYEEADILVFMYAIDDPTSLQKLNQKWIPECIHIIECQEIPVLIVANKKDLKDDPTVIERLALENKSLVALEQGRELLDKFHFPVDIKECSANDLDLVENAFRCIMNILLLSE